MEDCRRVRPFFGDLEQAEPLIAEARAFGMRTVLDIVPNVWSSILGFVRRAPVDGGRSAPDSTVWLRT